MKWKHGYKLILFFVVCLILTGCERELIGLIEKDKSSHSGGAVIESYTSEGEYIGQIDQMVFQMKVEDKIIKVETQIEDREILKGLKEGDPVTIKYSGPPNIDHEYLLEEVIVH